MECEVGMRRLSALVALLAVTLVVGLLGPPATARVAPRDPGTFNVIAPWGPPPARWRIVTGVEKAIGNVPARRKHHPRPRIYIATFMLDRKRTVDRLIAACRRGVSVRVILDDDVESRPSRRLRGVLNADNVRDRNKNGVADKKADRGPCDTKLKKKHKKKDKKKHRKHKKRDRAEKKGKKAGKKHARKKRHARKAKRPRPLPLPKKWGRDRSYVKTCDGACRGPGWNMHSKFYVFSRTGPYRHVVKMSSSNLNAGGALRGWNDMYTIRNRAKLYRTFARVHRTMTREKTKRPRLIQVKSGPYTVRFYPVRYAGPRIDPVGRDLDKIRCRPGKKKGHYRTKVFVSMFYWKGSRGERIARQLLELGRHGCRVQVVIGAPSRKIAGQLRRASRKRVITAYDSRWDLNMDGLVERRTHAKFVLVKGGYGHRRRSYQVMTGSGNWVRGSLAGGDEVSLNIRGKRPYKQYVRAWDRIRDHSRVMGRW
jgi:phosphatidylserine/phosphatidylglycerophosphate/cardiolipin synthase-like enzyme